MTVQATLNGRQVITKCIDCTANPNPTKGKIEIVTGELNGARLRYILFNLDGRVLKSNSIDSERTSFSIGNCPNGPYFLKVMNGDSDGKLIKILKTP